ncbi:chromosome partitioning protein [Campylobacter pinnipediorum subsp. caledonicus]|uniref:Chromosome partitioning protein n=1 Tax=Campylobacter pinnipediorum subsp. caledonicus TaxID=1874362 RepID=A0A1S6U8I1_9BACT|nr:ParB/RepB/Spo0J family partition protein [Campylobacter pinnipediorum]AQW86409.1 chromosome partitioning protein [Campylobacter pinnipediorum subsp. caledonicus]AQW88061.1 chromosome partitioning protein [Campylobacter pinnipediorum subsp. caledonicus]OPA71506.1 chromosome partitioning protein ParB [Campylobacter pinnipediorum subsp. caledonicus]
MAKKTGLGGRDFGVVFSDVEAAYNKVFETDKSIVKQINISLISNNPYQPRKNFNKEALDELSESIKRHGLIQPIVVIQKDDGYMLIAGERRLRATKLLGKEKISAIIADIESNNLRELALIENIQRENLNSIELALSYKELINEYQITQEALADILHKSRTQITNTMRLLTLLPSTQDLLVEEKLSQGHAKIIVGLSPENEKLIVDTIIGQKLNVRDTEKLVKKLKTKNVSTNKKQSVEFEHQNELIRLKKSLENFKIKTKIQNKKVILEFKDVSQIQAFLDKLE